MGTTMLTRPELASKSRHELDSRAINEVEEGASIEEITMPQTRQVVAPDFKSIAVQSRKMTARASPSQGY